MAERGQRTARPFLEGMRDGTVKESYAKHHHAKWVEGLEKEGKLETVERTVK